MPLLRIGIGLCYEHSPLDALPGWHASWAYRAGDGKFFAHSDQGEEYGPTFGAGDVVGCHFHIDKGITFYKNGESLGK